MQIMRIEKYNYKKIRDEVRKLVKEACYSPKNKFCNTIWIYHVTPVVEHSLKLGRKFQVDLEVLELAAYLHDYAGLVNYKFYKNHHLEGARLAGEILENLNFPKEKIKHVKGCIKCHRGSIKKDRKTIEAKILASADAMSHISDLADMFYLTFGVHRYKTNEGARWLKKKLRRSWQKIMPEGKRLVKRDYEIAMKIIDKAIK